MSATEDHERTDRSTVYVESDTARWYRQRDRLRQPAPDHGGAPNVPRRSVSIAEQRGDLDELGSLIDSGHATRGNVIVTTFQQDTPARDCRICSLPIIHPWSSWVCDIDGDVTRPADIGHGRVCGCNWCVVAQHATPAHRPPDVHPGACRREANRRDRAAERERQYARQRLVAVEVIRHEPHRTNKDVAAQLTDELGQRVAHTRVREARSLLEICRA